MADALLDRLDDLAARITGIESRLGAVEQALDWQRGVRAAQANRPPAAVGPPPPPLPPLPPPQPADEPVIEAILLDVAEAAQAVPPKPWPVASSVAGRTHTAPRPVSRPRMPDKTLEAIIGRNWTSWVGAIVVVLGVCFFLKYAWDQGWLAMSPAMRVITAITTGVAFGAAGAWVHRRRDMRVLAGTLSGAGVAIVMAACFAAHTMFDPPVFAARVALAGVCAAAAAGIWRALRMNVLSLAIVALLGAYLAPAILRSGRDESLSLIAYLAALATVGWCLAYLKPRWPALRWFCWTCTALWMTAWLVWFPMRGLHKPLAMVATTFFFAGFIGEAFLTLHRAFRIRDENDQGAVPAFATALENSLATLLMLTTAATFAAFYALLRGTNFGGGPGMFHLDPVAAIAVGLAGLHAMITFATPSRQFARSSTLQAAALLTLAVPLALGHVAITLAWLVLAVALAALGWRRENRALRVWSVVLLALALARLFTLDRIDASLQRTILQAGDQEVTTWLLLAWATAGLAHGVGWLVLPADPTSRESAVTTATTRAQALAAAGTLVFVAASAMTWHGVALTLLWIAGAAALVALAPWGRPLAYAKQAALLLVVIGVKWITLDGLTAIVSGWDQPVVSTWPVFNSMALAGVLIAALFFAVRRSLADDVRPAMAVAAGVVLFALANFETLRTVDYFSARFADFATAKVVALSVLWGVIGLASVVVGFAKELRPLRYAALGLLGLTLAKILIIDLAHARPVYRILSFLAVGGLLLCVSFVYHRHATPPKSGERPEVL